MLVNTRHARVLLNVIAIVAIASGIAFLGYGLMTPSEMAIQSSAVPATSNATRSAESLPPLAAFQSVKSIDLQRPLVDASQSSPFQWRLVGTMVDPAFSQAVFAKADGHTEMKAIGDSFDGAKVLAIEDGSATLSFNGQELVLRVEKEAK